MPPGAHSHPQHRGWRGLLLSLTLLAVSWVAMEAIYHPGTPSGSDASPEAFSATRARAVLARLVGDSVSHPIGSAQNAAVRARIVQEFHNLGYQPELEEGAFVCNGFAVCGMPVNILVRIDGTAARDDDAVLLAAHYDSVPAGPGASDDGAGVAVALEIARILRGGQGIKHPVIILLDDGEEVGELGAELFVKHHPWARNVKAAVNLEARGTSGTSLMFETGSANGWLMERYAAAIAHPRTNSIWYSIYSHMANGTDFTVFKRAGYQGFNFAFIEDVANYHTANDDLQHVDLGSVQQQGEQALGVVRALANSDIAHPSALRSEYFDIFGLVLVRLPQRLMLPGAAVALLLVVLATVSLVRSGRQRVPDVYWGLVGFATLLVTAFVAGMALLALARAVAPAGIPMFVAHEWVLLATFTALAGALIGALTAVLREKLTFWGWWAALSVCNGILACVLANILPGTSYIPLLACLTGGLALVLQAVGLKLRDGLERELAVLAYLLVVFTLLWPIVLHLYLALGTQCLPLLTVLVAYGAAALVGIVLDAPAVAAHTFRFATASLVAVGFAVAMLLPVRSHRSPETLNIAYQVLRNQDHRQDRAQWVLQSGTGRIPTALEKVAHFRALAQPLFTWDAYPGNAPTLAAEAPVLDLSVPQLTVRADTNSPYRPVSQRRVSYHVRIAPARPGDSMVVAFSPAAQVGLISVQPLESDAQVPADVRPHTAAQHWQTVRLVGLPGPTELSFDAVDVDFEVTVVNISHGLPTPAQGLLQARPPDTMSWSEGNTTAVAVTVRVGA